MQNVCDLKDTEEILTSVKCIYYNLKFRRSIQSRFDGKSKLFFFLIVFNKLQTRVWRLTDFVRRDDDDRRYYIAEAMSHVFSVKKKTMSVLYQRQLT